MSGSPLAVQYFSTHKHDADIWKSSWNAFVAFLDWYQQQNAEANNIFKKATSGFMNKMATSASQLGVTVSEATRSYLSFVGGLHKPYDTNFPDKVFAFLGKNFSISNQLYLNRKAQNLNRVLNRDDSQWTEACTLLLLWHPSFVKWNRITCNDTLLDMGSLFCMVTNKTEPENFVSPRGDIGTLFLPNKDRNQVTIANVFHCESGSLLSARYLCNNRIDCTSNNEDVFCENFVHGFQVKAVVNREWLLFADIKCVACNLFMKNILMFVKAEKYLNPNQPIFDKDDICADKNIQCLYELRMGTRHLAHCPNGSHLQDCTHFSCKNYFKCPRYYCLPWRYVCDGHWDCPFGVEELRCNVAHRPGFFHCFGSAVNIHPKSVCDNVFDCPTKDDEYDCELHNSTCPKNCSCIMFSLICSNATFYHIWSKLHSFHFVSLSGNSSLRNYFQHKAQEIVFLFLTNISELTSCSDLLPNRMPHLSVIVVNGHNFEVFSGKCSKNMEIAEFINLKRNNISTLECAFSFDSVVRFLSLSHNNIAHLLTCHFSSLQFLAHLNLKYNPIMSAETGILFPSLSHQVVIEVSTPELCCLVEHNRCLSKPKIEKCGQLLESLFLQVMSWVTAIVGILFNVSVAFVCGTELKTKKAVCHSNIRMALLWYVCLLASVYLLLFKTELIVAAANVTMGNDFPIKQFQWKSSKSCFAIFCLFLCFSFSNISFSLILELSRYCVVLFPLQSKFKYFHFTRKVSLWIATSITSLIFSTAMVPAFSDDVYVSSRCCLPMGFKAESNFDLSMSVLICVTYIAAVPAVAFLCFQTFYQIQKRKTKSEALASVTQKRKMTLSNVILCFVCQYALFWGVAAAQHIVSLMSVYDLSPFLLTCVLPFQALIHPLFLVRKDLENIVGKFCGAIDKQEEVTERKFKEKQQTSFTVPLENI